MPPGCGRTRAAAAGGCAQGFALFGILVVNIGVFASPYYGSGVVDPAFGRPLDLAASWVFGLLFETKFYLLFSFLFGQLHPADGGRRARPGGFPAAFPAAAGGPGALARRMPCCSITATSC